MATMPNPQRVPIVDPRTGMLAQPWIRPMSELFGAEPEGSVTNITNVTNTTVIQASEEGPVPAGLHEIDRAQQLLDGLLQGPPPAAAAAPVVLDQGPPPIPAVVDEHADGVVSWLVARVIELEREIAGLKQGAQA
jgi:hypothetical protein